jgi:hypothetical protein
MPAARKPASRTTTAPKRTTAAEPAALKRLNKSLEDSQKALAALRKDVGRTSARVRATSTTTTRGATAASSARRCGRTSRPYRSVLRHPETRPPGRVRPRGDQRARRGPPEGAPRRSASNSRRPVAGSTRYRGDLVRCESPRAKARRAPAPLPLSHLKAGVSDQAPARWRAGRRPSASSRHLGDALFRRRGCRTNV